MNIELRNTGSPAKVSIVKATTAFSVLWVVASLSACSVNDVPTVSAAAIESPTVRAIEAEKSALAARKRAERAALKLANSAFQDNRFAAPAGANALEHALRAREINARSVGAQEMLTDVTPIVATQVQAIIAAGDLLEAERIIALMHRLNPTSLTTLSLQRQLQSAYSIPLAGNQSVLRRGDLALAGTQ